MNDVSPLIRAAVFVADLEKSLAFYKDILNLEQVFFSGDLEGPVVSDLLGMPGTSYTRAIILKQPGPNFGMVGLFEVTRPAPPPVGKAHEGCHVGEICMVFHCSDLREVCEKLARHDATLISAPQRLKIDGLPGEGYREMTFSGPDGEMLNLIERDPAEIC